MLLVADQLQGKQIPCDLRTVFVPTQDRAQKLKFARFDGNGKPLRITPFRLLLVAMRLSPTWLGHQFGRAFVRFGFTGVRTADILYFARSVRFEGSGTLRLYGGTYLYHSVEIRLTGDTWLGLGNAVRINVGSMLRARGKGGYIDIGSGSYIGPYCVIDTVAPLVIGAKTLIGPHCGIFAATHGTLPGLPYIEQPVTGVGIRIGDNVWIGSGVRILDGVCIGEGSIVGAGAVVNCSFPAHSLIVGVPARKVRTLDFPE